MAKRIASCFSCYAILFAALPILLLIAPDGNAFSPSVRHSKIPPRRFRTFGATTSEEQDVTSMRVAQLREELKKSQVDFSDCFDKESLVARVLEARQGKVASTTPAEAEASAETAPESTSTETHAKAPESSSEVPLGSKETKEKEEPAERSSAPSQTTATTTTTPFDKEKELEELRTMSVRSLREELAGRRLRWAGLLEKEDLIQACLTARKQASNFSATGLLVPGQVTVLEGHQVQTEVDATDVTTPLLIDVFATWCGPCQMMAGPLAEAAAEWQSRVRVAKMDSDAQPEMASQLRVQGLPSLILFQGGKEVDRIEGALMKEQLLEWVESKLD